MDIIIASNNAHKFREFREILPEHRIHNPREMGIEFEHEETGSSFVENALGKARTLWSMRGGGKNGFIILADDSGLVVPALGGAPGVYSARFGEDRGIRGLDDAGRTNLLLEDMKDVTERSAYYVCCMVLFKGPDAFACVQETWNGSIARTPSTGTTGFGYDPVFFIPEHGKTVADLSPVEKSRESHRAKAVAGILALLSA